MSRVGYKAFSISFYRWHKHWSKFLKNPNLCRWNKYKHRLQLGTKFHQMAVLACFTHFLQVEFCRKKLVFCSVNRQLCKFVWSKWFCTMFKCRSFLRIFIAHVLHIINFEMKSFEKLIPKIKYLINPLFNKSRKWNKLLTMNPD